MTPSQIRWAQQHDWFIDVTDNKAFIIVRGDIDDPADELAFDNFDKLKEWAGY